MSEPDRLASLTLADFSALVGTEFTLQGRIALPMELLTATGAGEPNPGFRQPFSLIFRVPNRDLPSFQGPEMVDHPKLGRLEIFFVPLGPDQAGMRLEAIFN